MKSIVMSCIIALAASCCCGSLFAGEEASVEKASRALSQRLLGQRSGDFIFKYQAPENGQDIFEISSIGEKICIKGNNALAISSGLNWYLKYHCECHVSQVGNQLKLPSPLPALDQPFKKVANFKHRPFYNYCTFGYTMPWWNWEQWEKEIDWLALNGINLPLMIVGQEAVWVKTLTQFGMTEEQVLDWLVPPSHFPWMYMGNMESYGRPLPKSWVTSHVALGQKILKRMRELGMTPVLQGYYGNVPSAFKTLYPDAKINDTGKWGGHKRPSTLNPTDPLFAKIADAFYKEQEKLFGKSSYFQADLFHEDHAKKAATGLDKGKAGKAVFDAMLNRNPNAVWVMQSWIDTPHQAVIMGIPEDMRKQLLVIDLMCERYTTNKNKARWQRTAGFWGVNWCWASINYFGGRMGVFGFLDNMNEGPFLAKARKEGKTMTGLGAVPESTEQNPITFDLAFEPVWRDQAANMDQWVSAYQARRYGKHVESADKAWKMLIHSVFNRTPKGQGPYSSVICARPMVSRTPRISCSSVVPTYPLSSITEATAALLEAADELKDMETYQFDVVDTTRQMLAVVAMEIYKKMKTAYKQKDLAQFDISSKQFLELILDTDTLLGTRREFMMSRWINDARQWGTNESERDYLEEYARTLITVWCEKDVHHDYACREWNGLMKAYYYPRWVLSIAQWRDLIQGKKHPLDISKWEHDWCKDFSVTFQNEPTGDAVQESVRMYNKWKTIQTKP